MLQGDVTESQIPTSADKPTQPPPQHIHNNNNIADVSSHVGGSKRHSVNHVTHARDDVIQASSDVKLHAKTRSASIPAKPPRKKRPAPLPPSAMTSSPERAPAQVSPQTASSHTDSGVDGDVERRDVTVVHSRSSSRSSGFDSTSSPPLASAPAAPVTSEAAKSRGATMSKSKKRKAPPPPGAC